MSNDLGSMSIGIGLDTHEFLSGFAMVRERISGLPGLVAGAAIGVGAGIAGLGIQATKMAGDFQESMTQLVTGAGESEKNLGMVSQGILSMAPQVGTATQDLTAGLYEIESSGQHGVQALTTLKDAAEGAKVGAASLADVANGVTTEMTDYASAHLSAAAATNELITTVSLGKTHLADLAQAESTVLPAAAAMGIGLTDVNAALATMTGEGTDASSAATYLRQLLTALEAPAKKGATALADIGLSTKQVADEMKVSLPGTLQLITDHLKQKFPEGSAAYVAALKDIAGGSKQMQGILELTGSHLSTFQSNLEGITDAVKKGGDSITGWNKVQDDFNFKEGQAKEAVEGLGIKIGTALLPVAGQLFDKLSPMVTGFSDWIEKSGALSDVTSSLSSDLQDVGDFVGNDLVPGVTGLARSVEPIITDFITWNDKTGFLKNTLSDAGQLIGSVATDVETNLLPPVRSLLSNLEDWLTKSNAVHDALGILGTGIGITTQVLGGLITGVSTVVGWFDQSKPRADALKDALFAVGGVIATIKIVEFGQNVFTMGMQAKDAATHYLDLAKAVKDKLGDAYNNLTGKAKDASSAIEGVGTKAKTAEGDVGTSAKNMENDLGNVSTKAEAAETNTAGIGTAAEKDVGEVAGASTSMEADLGTVGTDAGIAATNTAGIGVAAEGSIGGIGKLANAMLPVALLMSNIQSFTDALGSNPLKMLKGGDWSQWFSYFTPGDVGGAAGIDLKLLQQMFGGGSSSSTQLPGATGSSTRHFASGGIAPGGLALVGEQGPELVDLPRGSSVFPNGTLPAKQPVHIHIEVGGREMYEQYIDDIGEMLVQRMRMIAGTRV